MGYFEKQLESDTIYEGRIITVRNDKVELVNGHTTQREVVEHPGGVTILPLGDDGKVYCVRQFRYPYARELLELPAGKLEKGEDPLECARRELGEETGFSADEFIYLGSGYPSPGYCQETIHIYLARGLKSGKAHLDPDEFLNVESYTMDELVDMIMKNELRDAKTIIGVLKTKVYLEEHR